MSHTVVVTLTSRSADQILAAGGSGDWRLDADRSRRSQFLVCTQNRHNPDAAELAPGPLAAHGSAFLIGRIGDVVRAPAMPDRWVIRIDEYTLCDIPNTWAKSGTGRYPVRYTTLEALGIDLDHLPPFRPLAQAGTRDLAPPVLLGLAEAPMPRLVPPPRPAPTSGRRVTDPWDRLDAILGQLDRVPDRPEPFDALAWDAQGLPQ